MNFEQSNNPQVTRLSLLMQLAEKNSICTFCNFKYTAWAEHKQIKVSALYFCKCICLSTLRKKFSKIVLIIQDLLFESYSTEKFLKHQSFYFPATNSVIFSLHPNLCITEQSAIVWTVSHHGSFRLLPQKYYQEENCKTILSHQH